MSINEGWRDFGISPFYLVGTIWGQL